MKPPRFPARQLWLSVFVYLCAVAIVTLIITEVLYAWP